MEKITLPFKRLDERAVLPNYAHEGDSGMDLYALEGVVVNAFGFCKLRTGVACEIPDGFELQIRPRSGLAAKKGVVAAFGTVDSGYRGAIGVTLFNHSGQAAEIAAGDRIAQLLVMPSYRFRAQVVDTLDDTDRGEDGFGSSGK